MSFWYKVRLGFGYGEAMVMEIQQLRYFLSASDTLSFAGAANKFQTSRQAISSSMQNLESEFGIYFFEKNNNRLSLTPEGIEFAKRVRRTVKSFDDLSKDFYRYNGFSLIFGIDSILISHRTSFFESLDEYKTVEGGCSVKFAQDPYQTVRAYVSSRHRDIGLLRTMEHDFPGCERVVLRSAHLALAVSRDNPLASKESIKIEDLKTQPLIVMSEYDVRYQCLLQACRNAGFECSVAAFIDEEELAVEAIKHNAGVALAGMYGSDKKDYIDEHYTIPFEDPRINIHDCLIYRKDSSRLEHIRHFVNYLQTAERWESWQLRSPYSDESRLFS
jgi:LysR family transcriptional regulator, transcription activator of glutamate synthase operon